MAHLSNGAARAKHEFRVCASSPLTLIKKGKFSIFWFWVLILFSDNANVVVGKDYGIGCVVSGFV